MPVFSQVVSFPYVLLFKCLSAFREQIRGSFPSNDKLPQICPEDFWHF